MHTLFLRTRLRKSACLTGVVEESRVSQRCDGMQVPEFRVAYTIVTDNLDALYKKLKPKGVTMTGLLAKAAGIALAKHPVMYAGEATDPPQLY